MDMKESLQTLRREAEERLHACQTPEALEQALHLGGTTLFEVLAEYRGISETKRAILESEAQARFALIELKALL